MKCFKGFTLMETIIVITISSIVFLLVFGFVYYFYKTSGYSLAQISAINNARRGMETMVREIREATYSDEGAYPVKQAQEQSFYFYSDIDKDYNIERVRYFLEEDTLKKGITKPEENTFKYLDENEEVKILSRNVRNNEQAIFIYYDQNNEEVEELEILTDIRLIQIELVVNTNPNRPPGEFTVISNAQLRNLKQE